MEGGVYSMATIEERLTALEQENAALRKSDELQTIALRALATKDALENLRETNNKIFDVLISHDRLTNERLGDLQTQMIELDGKIVGLQVETRQGFKDTQNQLVELDGKVVGVQTEVRQRFDTQSKKLTSLEQSVTTRFDTQEKKLTSLEQSVTTRFEAQDKKLDQIMLLLTAHPPKSDQDA
jgi:hypothetical protein